MMNRKAQPVFRLLFRSLSSRPPNPKFDFDGDADVMSSVRDGTCTLRRHPGSCSINPVSLPEPLMQAVETVLKAYPWKTTSRDAQVLNHYIWSRHAAPEPEEIKLKQQQVEDRIKHRRKIDPECPSVPEEERKRLMDSLQSQVHKRMKKEVYHWKAIQYDAYKCALYLAGRLAPDFAALVHIMTEIKKRDPSYTPVTMLDFGSGVGSAMWAMDQVWPGACQEVVCTDSSADMNSLADRLLRGGNLENPRLVRQGGTYFKQFLPLSSLLKYHLVISSRSLFELPNINTRLRTVDVLWRKTSGYLVLAEAGTNAGYRLVQEARDYVLELSRRAREEGESNPEGYVFSPCPHDKFCPKFFDGSNIPCNFEVSYKPLSLESQKTNQKERFTYVVLKRGRREESSEKRWPRVVESPLSRTKHVICRTCTPSGTLRELTATKRRHTPQCYKLMRLSRWGDLLPVRLSEVHDPSSGSGEQGSEVVEAEECIQN